MLQELLDEAGVNADAAVMVGDTEWDMVMADNIGMAKVAVGYGAHNESRLRSFAPDMLINDFEAILEWEF